MSVPLGFLPGLFAANAARAASANSIACLGNADCDVDHSFLATEYERVVQGEISFTVVGGFLASDGAFKDVHTGGTPVVEIRTTTVDGEADAL